MSIQIFPLNINCVVRKVYIIILMYKRLSICLFLYPSLPFILATGEISHAEMGIQNDEKQTTVPLS